MCTKYKLYIMYFYKKKILYIKFKLYITYIQKQISTRGPSKMSLRHTHERTGKPVSARMGPSTPCSSYILKSQCPSRFARCICVYRYMHMHMHI